MYECIFVYMCVYILWVLNYSIHSKSFILMYSYKFEKVVALVEIIGHPSKKTWMRLFVFHIALRRLEKAKSNYSLSQATGK